MKKFDFNIDMVLQAIWSYTPKVLGAIATLFLGFWIANQIANMIRKVLAKQDTDKAVQTFLSSLAGVGLKVMVLLAAAGMFGIETTSFIAIFSALAFAIGVALQGTLSHFASGVMLLIFKPFKVGDLVDVGNGHRGKVQEIQIFNTILKKPDNQIIIVPNSMITSNVIINRSGQGTRGVELVFSVTYDTNIDQARDIVLKVGKECPYVLPEPPQTVMVDSLGNNGIQLMTRPFVNSSDYLKTRFYMQEHVKKEFDAANIQIPLNQPEQRDTKSE